MTYAWNVTALNDEAEPRIDELRYNLSFLATTGYAAIPGPDLNPGGLYKFTLTAISLFAVRRGAGCAPCVRPVVVLPCLWQRLLWLVLWLLVCL